MSTAATYHLDAVAVVILCVLAACVVLIVGATVSDAKRGEAPPHEGGDEGWPRRLDNGLIQDGPDLPPRYEVQADVEGRFAPGERLP